MLFDTFTQLLPSEPSFTSFTLCDRNPLGGTVKKRRLFKPNDAMRMLHRRLVRYLHQRVRALPFATGAVPKSSTRRNVERHKKNRYFSLVDLRNAYAHVDGERLAHILCAGDQELAGQEDAVLRFLQQYCLDSDEGLIAGAPASPDLFNLYAGALLDEPLVPLCRQYRLTYTRYLDDLTFSTPDRPIGRKKRQRLRAVITQAGFTVNDAKARVYDLKKGPIVINGVGLELGGRLFVPRHYVRKIRGAIHAAVARGAASPHKISGMMGVFRAVTSRWPSNRTEQRVLSAYRRYRQSTQGQ